MIQHAIKTKMSGKTGVDLKLKVIQAANIFKDFKTKFLTEQIRASEDKEHTKFIQEIRTKDTPITKTFIDGISDYSKELVMADPEFEFGPFLVATNVCINILTTTFNNKHISF